MTGCGHEHEDGAYVLGALSAADRVAFERHLPGCAACTRSVGELAGLPGLLARVPTEVLDEGELAVPVPDTLLPSLLRQARRTRRRRRLVIGAAAAAVTAVVAVGIGIALRDEPASEPTAAPTAAAVQLDPVGGRQLSGWVSLTPVRWGTRLDLTCEYAEQAGRTGPGPGSGYASSAPHAYTLVVEHSGGRVEPVTSWQPVPGRTIHLVAGTAATLGDISGVTVRDDDGHTVLRLSR